MRVWAWAFVFLFRLGLLCDNDTGDNKSYEMFYVIKNIQIENIMQ